MSFTFDITTVCQFQNGACRKASHGQKLTTNLNIEMKEQIIFHRKQYLKTNRLQYLQKRSQEPEQNYFIFLINKRVLRGPFPRRIFLSTLACRFRVKKLSIKAINQKNADMNSILVCNANYSNGPASTVLCLERKMTAFQCAALR